MSGLDEEQLDELEERVAELLGKPWDKGTGRPRGLTFREALVVTSGTCVRTSSRKYGPTSSTWSSPRSRGSSLALLHWSSRDPRMQADGKRGSRGHQGRDRAGLGI